MNLHPLLAERVATTLVLGADQSLVLAGGGNTSVKCEEHGRKVIYVKGSGRDMAGIKPSDFTALDLEVLEVHRARSCFDDLEMMSALCASRLDPQAAKPSVESLVHAWLPFRFVDHSHADALLTVFASTSSPAAAVRLSAVLFGNSVRWLPFFASGFPLAQACSAAVSDASDALRGLVLHHHGLMAFGESSEACAANHQWMVAQAGAFLHRHGAVDWTPAPDWNAQAAHARCRILEAHTPFSWTALPLDPRFAQLDDAPARASTAALTPGHVLHVGPFPLWLGEDEDLEQGIALHRKEYRKWSARFTETSPDATRTLPRSAIEAHTHTAYAAGEDLAHAQLVARILHHNLAAKLRGSALGPWHGAPSEVVFAAENSILERAKLARRVGKQPRMVDKERGRQGNSKD